MNTPTDVPSLPEQIFSTLAEVLAGLLDSTRELIDRNGTDFLMGLLTLGVGWVVASMLRGLTSKMFRALGLDVIADRTRLRAFLVKNDIHRPPSLYLGWGIYVLVLYGTTVAAFDRMGLGTLADFLRHLASYLPRAAVVFLLLGLGIGLGRVAAALTARVSRLAGLPVPQVIGSAARGAVFLLSLFLSLNYLQWASQSVLLGGFALVIGLGLGMAILFTIAARGLTESLLNHPFLKTTYLPGDHIHCSVCRGKVVKVDAAATHVHTDEGLTIIPNRRLADLTVTVNRAPR
ncbi:MAG: hypothetical protein PF795_13295 [Kiritimatiellae bacterium]|jgi:small-conductance mechanosensitive channel|nr:hypothetical protein [Kiritimatiellia bacterium]